MRGWMIGLALATFAASVAFAAAPAGAQGIDETCLLPLTRFDADTTNVAFPDDSAQYFGAAYSALPGQQVVIRGRFPHARYMSFNVYDPQLRPADGLADVRLAPDLGSSNPFEEGADRTVTARSYTLRIVPEPRPADPALRAPNTLYAGSGADGNPNLGGLLLYRIYIPDRDRDRTGGVGLPTVTIEPAGEPGPAPASPCSTLDRPGSVGINELLSNGSTPADPNPRAPDPPFWRKFVNMLSSVAIGATGQPAIGPLDLDALGGEGGFLSNVDNAYVSAHIERGHGLVLATRFKAPTFPDTRPGTPLMEAGELRYWSLCANDPYSQRYTGCVNDDRAQLDADGYATVVVSTPEQRPANARRECGVNWVPWGVNWRNVLILRHMLPDAGFAASIQAAGVDRESTTMGGFFPQSKYYETRADFEALGCTAASTAVSDTARRRCARAKTNRRAHRKCVRRHR